MVLAFTKSFAVVLLLTVAAARGADPEPKESNDVLESARRDLQELPALERSLVPSSRLPESSLQVPLLMPAASASKVDRDGKIKRPELSEGWLLDGLKQAEMKRESRSTALSANDRISSEAMRKKLEGAPNPLDRYLQQWLAPQDRRLLGGEKSDQTPLERAGIREEKSFRPKVTESTTSLYSIPGERLLRSGDRVNPYLTPSPTDEGFLTTPHAPPADRTFTARPPFSQLSNSPVDQKPYPPAADTAPTLNGSAKSEALPPPTAPLLDEHRYFPQLRRF